MTQKSDEEWAQDLAYEIFSKCFLVMLAHVQRRIAKDPEYEEPKFLRAFLVAFEGVSKPDVKTGQNFMGVATSIEPNPIEAYAVVIKKRDKGFEIMELKDIARDATVGQREIMRLIQLSILLDNLPEDVVKWPKALEILNSSVPGINFIKFPNNQWRKYRPKLLTEIRQGRLPQERANGLDIEKLRAAKTFAEVPQHLRSHIGVLYASEKYPDGSTMSITSPDETIDKHKIFEMAKDMMYGPGAKYMNPLELPKVSD
jgi:hypothetical protein